MTSPPKDSGGFTISENLKSFEGPVLKCRGSRKRRASYLNELVIHEIRNNASAIFQNFLFLLENKIRPGVVKIPEVSAVRGWVGSVTIV